MKNLDSILKRRDITLPTKVHIVKAMVFPLPTYKCKSCTIRNLSTKELMLLNCGAGEDSWESLGQQDQTAAAAKSLQSCPTLYDPIDGSPPGSPVPGILQARILEWVAISLSKAWKWKVKSEKWKWSCSVVSNSSRPHGLQPPRLLCPWDFPGKSTGVGCHHLLQRSN